MAEREKILEELRGIKSRLDCKLPLAGSRIGGVPLHEFLETCDEGTLERSFAVLVAFGYKAAADVFRRRKGLQGDGAWINYVRRRLESGWARHHVAFTQRTIRFDAPTLEEKDGPTSTRS